MATVNQVYELLNAVQEMAYGETAIAIKDTAGLVSLGQLVLSSDTNKDSFVHVLFDRIGMTLTDRRLYDAEDNNLIKREFDYGVIMQKIHVEPIEAEENPEWLIGENDFTPTYAPVIKPVVKQKVFKDMATYETGVTIPDNMLKTAFTKEVDFSAFLVAIRTALANGLELAKERAVDLTRATMIASILKKGGAQAVNLLALYNAKLGESDTPLTVEQYLEEPKALCDGAMEIDLTADRLGRFNKVFNEDGDARFTPRTLVNFDVLNVFEKAIKYKVRPVIFNESFIQLPNYKSVPYWEGAGTSYAFDDISKVAVHNLAEQTGVIGVMYDVETAGVNIFGEESAYDRNERAHYTTHYRQMTAQYYYDSSEQGVVFYLAETE